MNKEDEQLTKEQRLTSERLAKIMWQDINHNRLTMEEISNAFRKIPREFIPCRYMDNKKLDFMPSWAFTAVVINILEEIKSGEIELPKEKRLTKDK